MIGFRRREPEAADVELTPLIDVVFQLLVFFLLTSAFIQPSISVNLPDVVTGESGDESTLSITIDAGGRVFFGTRAVPIEQLEVAIEQEAEARPLVRVAVYGDVNVSYGAFMRVLDACRVSGLRNVVLMVRESTQP